MTPGAISITDSKEPLEYYRSTALALGLIV